MKKLVFLRTLTNSSLFQTDPNFRDAHNNIRGQLESGLSQRLGTLLLAGDKVEVTTATELTLPPEKGLLNDGVVRQAFQPLCSEVVFLKMKQYLRA